MCQDENEEKKTSSLLFPTHVRLETPPLGGKSHTYIHNDAIIDLLCVNVVLLLYRKNMHVLFFVHAVHIISCF